MMYKLMTFFIISVFLIGCTARSETASTAPSISEKATEIPVFRSPTAPTEAETETTSEAISQATAPATIPLNEPTPIAISEDAADSVVITATVGGAMLSAQVIVLQEPVHGFTDVALTQDTRLVSIEGDEPLLLRDLPIGAKIQITGQPGSPGSLIASEIHILP